LEGDTESHILKKGRKKSIGTGNPNGREGEGTSFEGEKSSLKGLETHRSDWLPRDKVTRGVIGVAAKD